MDELDNNKLKAEDDEREVESEENQRGEEIEVNEDRLPSRAMAIHEHIRQEGEKEMERDALALLWSAIAAGLSMGASLLAKGIFHVKLEGIPGGFLLENLGYTFGFIIVIMARQQLFTENTVTAVLPVMHNPTLGNVGLLMRLWSVVLAGNLIGTAVAAWAFNYMPIFDEPTPSGLCQHRRRRNEKQSDRDVRQCDYFRLAGRHHGLDVSCRRRRQNRGDYSHDLAYRPGGYHPYCGGLGRDPLSGV